jgi:hypothetical protein
VPPSSPAGAVRLLEGERAAAPARLPAPCARRVPAGEPRAAAAARLLARFAGLDRRDLRLDGAQQVPPLGEHRGDPLLRGAQPPDGLSPHPLLDPEPVLDRGQPNPRRPRLVGDPAVEVRDRPDVVDAREQLVHVAHPDEHLDRVRLALLVDLDETGCAAPVGPPAANPRLPEVGAAGDQALGRVGERDLGLVQFDDPLGAGRRVDLAITARCPLRRQIRRRGWCSAAGRPAASGTAGASAATTVAAGSSSGSDGSANLVGHLLAPRTTPPSPGHLRATRRADVGTSGEAPRRGG